jgi:hypothetical protein
MYLASLRTRKNEGEDKAIVNKNPFYESENEHCLYNS